MIRRSLMTVAVTALLAAACGGEEGTPTTTAAVSTTAAATTTEAPTTTTTEATSATTGTTTTTTTVPVEPPPSGFYIVDEAHYPYGVPIFLSRQGSVNSHLVVNPHFPKTWAVVYLLEEGAEIRSPFGGYHNAECPPGERGEPFENENQGITFHNGREVPIASVRTGNWGDRLTRDTLALHVWGESLTFVCPTGPEPGGTNCPCPVSRGDVIARVTDPDQLLPARFGHEPEGNVGLGLGRWTFAYGFFAPEGPLWHRYFPFVP
jgi:hypothetical protein